MFDRLPCTEQTLLYFLKEYRWLASRVHHSAVLADPLRRDSTGSSTIFVDAGNLICDTDHNTKRRDLMWAYCLSYLIKESRESGFFNKRQRLISNLLCHCGLTEEMEKFVISDWPIHDRDPYFPYLSPEETDLIARNKC